MHPLRVEKSFLWILISVDMCHLFRMKRGTNLKMLMLWVLLTQSKVENNALHRNLPFPLLLLLVSFFSANINYNIYSAD